MLSILLVFSMEGADPRVSDRIFETKDECAQFVESLSSPGTVKPDYTFKFISKDNVIFTGKCVESKET